MVNMIDHWGGDEYAENSRLIREINALREHGKTESEKAEDRKAKDERELAKATGERNFFEDMGFTWNAAENAWIPKADVTAPAVA